MTDFLTRFRHMLQTTPQWLAVFCVSFLTVSATWAQGLGIAAVVNDDVISMLDLNARVTMILETTDLPNTPEARARITPQVLRGLIDEKLKLQESREQGISVAQEDIEANLQGIAARNKLTVEQLTNNLRNMGVPITALTSRLEAELAWQVFVTRRLARQIQIGEEEITDEINLIEKNAGKPEYKLSEIYLPVDEPGEDSEVRAVAERLVAQLRQGAAPFEALAQNFSAAPSAAVGGDLGWVQFPNLDRTLQKAISGLEPGTFTPPIRTLGGYYIMLLRDVRTSPGITSGEATLTLSQYHVPVQNLGDANAVNAAQQQLVNATANMRSCEQMNAAGEASGSLMSGALGEMKLSTLPDNLKTVLADLPVGQPSRPVQTGGGLAVLMICDRDDGAVDMEQVRKNIRNKLLEQRVNVAAQRKLRDLRRQAFVDVRI